MVVERIIPNELESNDRALIEHLERYELAASFLRFNDEVVDASCGVGYGSVMLAKKCGFVYGFDISEGAISYAVKQYQSSNIKFIVKDLDQDSLPECDVFVSFETVEHLKYPEAFLEKVKCKTRRLVLISTPIIPTKNVNPFHLHDFNKEQIEKLLFPWQPVYFCIQSGSSGEIYGVWVFKKELAEEEGDRFLFQNLKDQQKQFMYHHKLLVQQKVWSNELEEGKAWLENQLKNWQNEAEWRTNRILNLEKWIAELEDGKAWLEEQRQCWQKETEERGIQIKSLQDWVAELEKTKAWLGEQWQCWQKEAERKAVKIQELECRITEPENNLKMYTGLGLEVSSKTLVGKKQSSIRHFVKTGKKIISKVVKK